MSHQLGKAVLKRGNYQKSSRGMVIPEELHRDLSKNKVSMATKGQSTPRKAMHFLTSKQKNELVISYKTEKRFFHQKVCDISAETNFMVFPTHSLQNKLTNWLGKFKTQKCQKLGVLYLFGIFLNKWCKENSTFFQVGQHGPSVFRLYIPSQNAYAGENNAT